MTENNKSEVGFLFFVPYSKYIAFVDLLQTDTHMMKGR